MSHPPDRDDGTTPVSAALGELLQPTEAERASFEAEAPPWVESVARATTPDASELRRLRARALDEAPARGRGPALGLAAALALLFLALRPGPELLPAGELVVAGAEPRHITPDATVEGAATLSLWSRGADGAVVALRSGAAVFEVDPEGEARDLRVRAGPVEVRVTGTRFLVAAEGEAVSVSVERGSVSVRSPDGEVSLRAGESWRWTWVVAASTAAPPTLVPRAVAAPERAPSPQLPPSTPALEPRTAAPTAPEAPGPTGEALARRWVSLLDAREAGEPAGALLPQVESFLSEAAPGPLSEEAALLRLELLAEAASPALALAEIDRWLTTHPEGDRAGPVLLLAGAVAAGGLGDCDRARPYLIAARAAGQPSVRAEAQRHLDACGP